MTSFSTTYNIAQVEQTPFQSNQTELSDNKTENTKNSLTSEKKNDDEIIHNDRKMTPPSTQEIKPVLVLRGIRYSTFIHYM